MNQIRKWADSQQYVAAPMQAVLDLKGNIVPSVTLLSMSPDPLGSIAAFARMYRGEPTYHLYEITDEDRRQCFEDVQKTHLQAPLEAVNVHFFIEGVTRSFTHQMVRQRTAVYAQESLRFAYKENLAQEISLPPSIAALPKHHPTRQEWDKAIDQVEKTYKFLVNNGIPAEDARGLLPHATTTRLNYKTDLRNLVAHAGNRLCTQAQFEWRTVFLGIVEAIRHYPDQNHDVEPQNYWQFEAIADSALFRPVCYQLNRCPFKASFDRACTIRERVEAFSSHGIASKHWDIPVMVPVARQHEGSRGDEILLGPIMKEEWLLDPAAARVTSGGAGHD